MSFAKWLMQFVEENSPLGDLARDVAKDKNFPRSRRYETIYSYLEDGGASDACMIVFEEAWENFDRKEKF